MAALSNGILVSLLGSPLGPPITRRNLDNHETRLSGALAALIALEATVVSYNTIVNRGNLQVPQKTTGGRLRTSNDVVDARAKSYTREEARGSGQGRRGYIDAPLRPLPGLG